MLDKSLAWCGNALLAALLVLLCGTDAALAQDRNIQVPDKEAAPAAVQPSGRITVPLTGQGESRRFENLEMAPARYDTGLIEIGDAKSLTLELRHTGRASDAPIEIGSASVEGKSASEYAVDFAGGVTLGPGDAQPITITFTPTVPGQKSAALVLEVVGSTSPHVTFIAGEARYPLVSELALSTAELDFGQVIYQSGAVSKPLTLTNTGDPGAPPVTVSAATLGGDQPGDFQLGFAPVALAPGESVDVPVTLGDGALGNKLATVEFQHDGNNPAVEVDLAGEVIPPQFVPITFGVSTLSQNVTQAKGTVLQFGPDDKLYVAEVDGLIRVYDVVRNGKNNYQATQLETIDLVKNVPNHDDDGNPEPGRKGRQVTGIHVVGTAAAPVIWVASSDPEHGAGPSGADKDLDTNSGILHKLTKTGGGWQKQDLVRGLPRSEENHTPNGLVALGTKVYLLSGGNTNQGVPSNNFAQQPEYALSGALLEIDVGAIGNGTYDLPTLDDEDRPGADDANDPFGGNDGKNQAILEANGPVKIHASGLRNAYDLVLTESGKFYTFDNGPNSGWGGVPDGSCDNDSDDGGTDHQDNLHLLTKGSYAGHPNPARGNAAVTFNGSNPQSPIEVAPDPRECVYLPPGQDGSLTSIGASTNGMVEYTASNFLSSMKGDLLAITFNEQLWRVELNGGGDAITSKSVIASGFGSGTLGLEALGDDGPFPGTIWVTSYYSPYQITVLEPDDY